MPATFENSEFRFLYPENWVLTEEEPEEWPRTVSLQSPGGAIWSLHVYPSRQDPQRLALDAVLAVREMYEGVDREEAFEKIADVDAVGYNLDFFYLDFVVHAEVRSFVIGARTFVTYCQAESREFEQLAEVFRAITWSLFQPVEK